MNPASSILITGCSSGKGAAAGYARASGRDFHLTDVHGNVFHEGIA